MNLWYLILTIVAVGIALWAVNAYVPMASAVRRLLNVVVILILVFVLLEAFGVIDVLKSVHVGGHARQR